MINSFDGHNNIEIKANDRLGVRVDGKSSDDAERNLVLVEKLDKFFQEIALPMCHPIIESSPGHQQSIPILRLATRGILAG